MRNMKHEEEQGAIDWICPLSLCKLPADPLDVAFIWSDPTALFNNDLLSSIPPNDEHGCGHKCTLQALVQYLQHPATIAVCPVCGVCPISAVCDGAIKAEQHKVKSNNLNNEVNKSFLFRFGKQVYRLAVIVHPYVPPPSPFIRLFHILRNKPTKADTTVQGRLCQVFQLDDKTLKIIRKGKLIYPNSELSYQDISNALLEYSSQDDENKKASMIVMGTTIQNSRQLVHQPTKRNGILSSLLVSITTLLWTKSLRLVNRFLSFVYICVIHSPITMLLASIFRRHPRPTPPNQHFRLD